MIENFDKLPFERKVDVLVAVHIFGVKDISIRKEEWLDLWCPFYKEPNHFGYLMVSDYTHLLTSAWDIVRKFDYCYLFRAKDFKGGQWECKLTRDDAPSWSDELPPTYAWAETEQLAICYAGLKAVGFDVKGFLKEEGKV